MASNRAWIKRFLMGAAVSAAGLWASDQLIKQLYQPSETSDEQHTATTDDNVDIALWRHTPQKQTAEPVLVVHGLGANHFHMDVDRTFSVARYLKKNGYDVWCIELRGRRGSDIPDRSWSFDDYAQRDIPAAIDYILEETGYEQLHWVGHSMGGMLYYAVAGAVGYGHKLASAVSAGGPFHGKRPGDSRDATTNYPFGEQTSGVVNLFVPALELLRRLRLPWPVAARWSALAYPGLKHLVPRPLARIMVNPDNIDNAILRKAGVRCVERVGARVLAQFIEWGLTRNWVDGDGRLNYRKGVSEITVPTLLIAGSADKMCPVHNQQSGFEQLGTGDKKLVVAGTEQGFHCDYSHIDMIYGRDARDEIFPLILDWVENHPIDKTR